MVDLASGAAVRPLLADRWSHWIVLLTGTTLLLFSIFCFFAAVWRLEGAACPKRLPRWSCVFANAALSLAPLAAQAEIWAVGP